MKTSQLEETLRGLESFDEEMVRENACPELYGLLDGLMTEKNVTKSELIKKLNIDRNYGYQLFNGTRMLTRDHLIRICILLEAETEQLQDVLKAAEKKPLYVRNLFDARVFYAIEHKMPYDEASAFIWGNAAEK